VIQAILSLTSYKTFSSGISSPGLNTGRSMLRSYIDDRRSSAKRVSREPRL
jgi:hypothetical protein